MRKYALTESDITPIIANLVREQGIVYWIPDIYDAIEQQCAPLLPEDLEPVGGYDHRYQCIAQNNKCHKTVIKQYTDIVQIHKGFALRNLVKPEEITDDGLWSGSANGVRKVKNKIPKNKQVDQWTIINILWTLYKAEVDAQNNTYMMLVRNRDAIVGEVLKLKLTIDDREGIKEGIKAATAKYLPKAA